MGAPLKLFVDTDVIISSLISSSGASYTLLNQTKNVVLYISNFSVIELERVTARLNLDTGILPDFIASHFEAKIDIGRPYDEIKTQFSDYVLDVHDAHIVAGAKQSSAAFLISYNIRHFQADKLKQDFQIILMTPGIFLQYLRSL